MPPFRGKENELFCIENENNKCKNLLKFKIIAFNKKTHFKENLN